MGRFITSISDYNKSPRILFVVNTLTSRHMPIIDLDEICRIRWTTLDTKTWLNFQVYIS